MTHPMWNDCIVCGEHTLKRLLAISENGTRHRSANHEFVYAYKILCECQSCNNGIIEVHSHDCFQHYSDEPWDLWWWYVLPESQLAILKPHIETCSSPLDAGSACKIREQVEQSASLLYGGIRGIESISDKRQYAEVHIIIEDDVIKLTVTQK